MQSRSLRRFVKPAGLLAAGLLVAAAPHIAARAADQIALSVDASKPGAKIDRNRSRDEVVRTALAKGPWRQLVVWECAIRGTGVSGLDRTVAKAATWLRSSDPFGEIQGL